MTGGKQAGGHGELRPQSFSQEREIFKNEFVRLYAVRADFGAFTREYFVADKGRRVGVVLWRGADVLLVRQYRFLINDMSWELPGGGIRPGETPEQAAIRECKEEGGISCRSVSLVLCYEQGIDVTKSPAWIFQSKDFAEDPSIGANDETDMRAWVPFDECVKQVFTGEIKDSMTMMALLAVDSILRRR